MDSKIKGLQESVAEIGNDSSIIFSGMQLSRVPIAIVDEIAKQQIMGLKIYATPNPLPVELLIKAGCVAETITAFMGFACEFLVI